MCPQEAKEAEDEWAVEVSEEANGGGVGEGAAVEEEGGDGPDVHSYAVHPLPSAKPSPLLAEMDPKMAAAIK
jgi:hypothetical protein